MNIWGKAFKFQIMQLVPTAPASFDTLQIWFVKGCSESFLHVGRSSVQTALTYEMQHLN